MQRLGPLVLGGLIVLIGTADAARKEAKPAPPGQVATAIDRMLATRLAQEKVTPSPGCDDAEFLRRVYLDITGKIPSSEQTVAYLDSSDPHKRAKLIDQLLASSDYGRHFATIWRNLMIRPDANMIRQPDTTPLVTWLADHFNKNTGWDHIVRDLLTVEGEKPQGLFYQLNGDTRANPQSNVIAGTVGQLFMGVQLSCAECHNHPFVDTWKQNDFWGVAAFFGNVRAQGGGRPAFGGPNIVETTKGKLDRRNMAPKMVGAAIVIPDSSFKQIGKRVAARLPHGAEPKLEANKPFRPAFADWLVARENPYFAKNAVNRLWAHFFGRGFANPVGEMSEVNPPSHPELLDALAKQFAASGFDQKALIRAICNSQAYQRTSKPTPGNKGDNTLFARMEIKVLTPEVLYDTLTQALGVDDLAPRRPGNAAVGKKKKKKANAARFPAPTARQQFIDFYTTREVEGDATEFTHGIPQALRLMNQQLFNTGGATVERAARAGGGSDKVVERLYLAVLSRRPTDVERKEALAYLAKQKDPMAGYRGVFWALLNSAEFIINR